MDETYEPASFEVADYPVVRVAVTDISETEGIRLAPRERPFRKGAKLDSTGATVRKITLTIIFSNDITEAGVTDDGGPPLFPDRFNLLRELFRTEATGTLNLPSERGIRAKAESWNTTQASEQNRGGAVVQVTFAEDNEDDLDREAIVQASPRATLNKKVEEAKFDAESEGIAGGGLENIAQFVAGLVSLANTPGDLLDSVTPAVVSVRRSIDEVTRNFSSDRDGRDQFWRPESFLVRMRLLEIEDLSARAAADARRSQERVKRFYPARDTTIWLVATQLRQPADRLMDLNVDVEDFASIKAKTPLWVLGG